MSNFSPLNAFLLSILITFPVRLILRGVLVSFKILRYLSLFEGTDFRMSRPLDGHLLSARKRPISSPWWLKTNFWRTNEQNNLIMNELKKWMSYECICEQGRIHGHQLRTGGQGRKCAFSHFSTQSPLRTNQPTNQPTNRPTDWRTDKASYRVACPQLKMAKVSSTNRRIDQRTNQN